MSISEEQFRFVINLMQGSYSNNEIKFQDIPVYTRMDRTKFPGLF